VCGCARTGRVGRLTSVNLLERRARRRAQKKLRAWLEPGEEVLEFDVGTRARVQCIATDRALYLLPRGTGLRLPYGDFARLHRTSTLLAVVTKRGSEFSVSFSHPRPGFIDTVVREAKAHR
jgi:hypothetical protein